jgi:predicted Zn-dependent peptidase
MMSFPRPGPFRTATIKVPLAGDTVKSARLQCGMPVFLASRPGWNSKIALLAVRYGSLDTEFVVAGGKTPFQLPAGTAHFLEHQMFKKDYGDISDAFADAGGSVNACTSHSWTAYFFTGTGNFIKNLRLLVELVAKPHFLPENVNREALIIAQEISAGEDHPETKLYRNLLNALYHNHPVRIDVAGTVESVRDVTAQTLVSTHERFYHPSNMVCAVAGDVAWGEMIEVLQAEIAKYWKHGTSEPAERVCPAEPSTVNARFVEHTMSVTRPRCAIGFKDKPVGPGGAALLRRDVTTSIALELLFGKGTKFFNRIYESGLIDETFSYGYSGHSTYGMTVVGGDTDSTAELRDRILERVSEFLKDSFKRRELEGLKRKTLGKYLMSFDSDEAIGFGIVNAHCHDMDPFSLPKVLAHVTRDGIMKRVKEHMLEDKSAFSVVKPPPAATK